MKQNVIEELDKPLSLSHVKKREGAGKKMLDYLEGWFVISEANRIFGFDGWCRRTTRIELIGSFSKIDNYGKEKTHAAYRASVLITVDGVEREGTGFGNGIDANELNAHELAIKEAETDAMKRAFMTFGNPFGLALYDKERNGVEAELSSFYKAALEVMLLANTKADLNDWKTKNAKAIGQLSDHEKAELRKEYAALLANLPITANEMEPA